MSTAAEALMVAERIEYRSMSFEEYLELPRDVRAEWVNGVAIVTPPARLRHQLAEAEILIALRGSLSDVTVATEVGVRTAEHRYRIGDVVVLAGREVEDVVFTERSPLVVVEVLSASTKREDLIRKPTEYLAAGVQQYWIVDIDEPGLDVYTAGPEGWESILKLTADAPVGSVSVGDHGTVELDLNALIAV